MNMPLRVALLDLNHITKGLHTRTMPLGIGLIASHLLNNVQEKTVAVHLYKFTNDLENDSNQLTFDVIGFSMYAWNTSLNLYYSKKLKEMNPDAIVVCGGPNINYTTEGLIKFLETNSFIDYLVQHDGETAFTEIVLSVLDKKNAGNEPVKGAHCLDRNSKKLIFGGSINRLNSLDDTPSPYLNGIMDKFFTNILSPFIETNRGCPFACTFCHTAQRYYNKLLYVSLERLSEELTFFAKRFKDFPNLPLFIADNNFGMFDRDFEVTQIIRKAQDKYRWPVYIDTTVGKSQPQKVSRALKELKPRTLTITASTQSMTPQVLKNIKRRNLKIEELFWIQNETKTQNSFTVSELIIGLPGETKDSFFDSVAKLINVGIDNIVPYTLMNLRGTPLYDDIYKDRHSYKIKYRIVPKQFGKYKGDLVFDTEEVVVATPTMTFDDYLECRGLSYFLQIINNNYVFEKIRYLLLQNNCNVYDWIIAIMDFVKSSDGLPSQQCYAFIEETKNELWDSSEAIYDFFRAENHYQELLSGKYGENLLSKYSYLMHRGCFDKWLDIAIETAKKILLNKIPAEEKDEYGQMLAELKYYLLETCDIEKYFFDTEPNAFDVALGYDFEKWTGKTILKRYPQKKSYKYLFSEEARKIFNNIKNAEDRNFQIQLLYRSKGIAVLYPQVKG